MKHRVLFCTIVSLVVLGLFLTAGATEITVTSSFPTLFEFVAPSDPSLEGSVTVTAHADGPIQPVSAPPWLDQVDASTWSTTYLWNEVDTRETEFVDAVRDTYLVQFPRTTVMPLDLERHDLPMLLIETDPANLWDPETGLYVWGNHDNFLQRGEEWERPATLTYLEADGTEIFSEPVGLRINGESSRDYNQKGLRFYFDDYGSADYVEHDFFGDGPIRCERLVLRGNRYTVFAISSALNEPLHRDLGNPGSRWAYVAVYLNGEYWGAYSLRERLDSKWVETTHDWADDDYVLIKDHAAEAGDYGRWESVLAGCQPPGDFASHSWFQWLDAQLDLESYFDWIMINACGESADNMHGKNMALLQIGGARFDFMAWDEDILYQTQNFNDDHFSFYASGDETEFALYKPTTWFSGGPWSFTFDWNNLLRAGMQNAEFKARFRQRAADLLGGPLSVDSMNARLDSVIAIQEDEWGNHRQRWPGGMTYAYQASIIRGQFGIRHQYVSDFLDAFLDTWADPVELSEFSIAPLRAGAQLAWHTERETDCAGWIVERSEGSADAFYTVDSYLTNPVLIGQGGPDVPWDYAYADTTAPAGIDLYYRLSHADGGGQVTVHDWVETLAPSPVFLLCLNELMASNDATVADPYGEYDDWAELYNGADVPVSLAGLFLTDNLSRPTKWALPDLTMDPGEFLLVWCDEDLEQGSLHASFKLGAGGEELGLFAGLDQDNLAIDTVVFGAQVTDVSLGRSIDGAGTWIPFTEPTPGTANSPWSPVDPQLLSDGLQLSPAWPNPATGALQIQARLPRGAGRATLRVYDLKGALVRELSTGADGVEQRIWTWDGRDAGGQRVATGVYLLRLQVGGETRQSRVVLLR